MKESERTVALVAGVGLIGVGVGWFLLSRGGIVGGKTKLTISVYGTGGSTDPSPGTYEYARTESVTVTAVPESGYEVLGWLVDGVSQGAGSSITLSMNVDHDVVVTFKVIGPPPPNPPARIVNLTAPPPLSVNLKQKYKGYWFWLDSEREWRVDAIRGEYDAWDFGHTQTIVEFQVQDIYGKGVPNIPVLLYTSDVDVNKGALYLGEGRYVVTPLRAISDANGIVRVQITYRHTDINRFSKERCYQARIYWGITREVRCLTPGDKSDVCNFLLNGCTWEEQGIAMNAPCPDATIAGPEYEYETVPLNNVLYAEYEDNRLISSFCYLLCTFGIRNMG